MAVLLSDLPSIETERLRIERLQAADAEVLAAMTNEPAILEAVDFLDHQLTVADAEELIRGDGDGRDCFWGIRTPDRPELIGTVGTHLRSEEIEIGYWFATAVRGRGLATEAVRAVVDELWRAFPKHSFFAECRPENGASWRLLERIGFKPDGRAGHRPERRRFVFVATCQPNARITPSSAPSVTSAARR